MNKKPTILFFFNHSSSFIKKDLEILAAEFTVYSHDFYREKKWQVLFSFSFQKLFLLRHIPRARLVLVQFAGYHSLLPVLYAKICRKPCVIISGGTDAHYFPNIGYGNWQKRFLKTFTALSFKWCSHLAPKHKTLMYSEYRYDNREPALQGISARLPNLKIPFTEITNGYDSAKWHCTAEKKPNTFITVSGAWQYSFQQQLKGIDLILEAAKSFPEAEFIILGVDDINRIPNPPANVTIQPAVKNEELITIFSRCEFYLQLSMAEGFPNSICEAMLCECIPIGSAVFSIPEIIGDCGYILHHRSGDELKQVLAQALTGEKKLLGKKARQRIAENYSLQNRQQKLIALCRHLMQQAV